MDKQIVITSQTTRNDLLMQLMKESKTVSQNIILVLESIPGFINTHVSLAVFNAMLKGYPKPIYWYSRHPAVINFLRLSNILRIWKPPINEDKNPGANPLFKIIPSSFKSPSGTATNTANKVQSKASSPVIVPAPAPNPRLIVPPSPNLAATNSNAAQPSSKLTNTRLASVQDSSGPGVKNKTLKSLTAPNVANLKPTNAPTANSGVSEIKSELTSPFDRAAVASTMANAPKQLIDKVRDKTTQARMSQIQKDLDKIQPPDFNNLDDLIYKIESTKQALEKKHNSLNKSALDKEINSDYGGFNWGLSVLIFVGVCLVIFFIFMAITR